MNLDKWLICQPKHTAQSERAWKRAQSLRYPPPVIWTPEAIEWRKAAYRLAAHMHGILTPEERAFAFSPAPPPPPPPPPGAFERVAKPVCEAIGTGIGYLLLWGLGTVAIAGGTLAGCVLAVAIFPQAALLIVPLFGIGMVCTWIRFMHSTIGCHKHL
jgi:hypothetical protein